MNDDEQALMMVRFVDIWWVENVTFDAMIHTDAPDGTPPIVIAAVKARREFGNGPKKVITIGFRDPDEATLFADTLTREATSPDPKTYEP